MKQFIDYDTKKPIEPQVVLLDGYALAERLLEGCMFEISIDELTGELVCNGVQASDQNYYDDFSAKKHVEWQKEAVEEINWDRYFIHESDAEIDVVDV